MANAEELTCAELVELVTEFLEGTLDRRDRSRFEQHLSECPHCAAYVDQIRLTVAVAGRLREDHLKPAAKASLLHAFRDWHRPSPSESPG